MNCSTCRHELSQCLDGRLPSGRRTVVLQHAETCSECGSFWRELQAAQDLTLSLRQIEVSSDFREGLWDRIRAGEGTPTAVLEESVSVGTKLRYAATGAAAAAVLLLGLTFVRGGTGNGGDATLDRGSIATTASLNAPGAVTSGSGTSANGTLAERTASGKSPAGAANAADRSADRSEVRPSNNQLQPRQHTAQPAPYLASYGGPSGYGNTMVSPKPLTFNVLALETARQLEHSYADASVAVRMLHDPRHDRDRATAKVLRSAREMHEFGELLLDLRERERVRFNDIRVDADLTFAVEMLDQVTQILASEPESAGNNGQLVERFVVPTLRKERLAQLSRSILVAPTRDHLQEVQDLMRLNRTRPGVVSKLFVVFGDPTGVVEELSLVNPGIAFSFHGACGPSWVAPRSEVRRNSLLRMFGDRIEIHIEQNFAEPQGAK
ncbi:MAG: anti-sigma factor [Planctomycetota bacterium]